jgi:hypothetical protein
MVKSVLPGNERREETTILLDNIMGIGFSTTGGSGGGANVGFKWRTILPLNCGTRMTLMVKSLC